MPPDNSALTMADVLGKTGPALSATSDMPTAASAAPSAPSAPATAPTAAAPADAPSSAPTPAPAESDGKDETPGWMKAEITKERNRRRDAEARVAESERLLKEALERIPKPADPKAAPAPQETQKPKRADFDDPDAYDEALIDWSTQRAAAQLRAEQQTEAQRQVEASTQAKQAEQQKVVQQAWAGRRDKALAEMPDYVEVAENPDVQISMPMAAVITSVENGPQVAYHLGKNPTEAARIAALSPFEAAVEVRLLARDLAAKKPEITKAPDPAATRIGARSDAGPKTAQDESMEEYAARRNKELRAATLRH